MYINNCIILSKNYNFLLTLKTYSLFERKNIIKAQFISSLYFSLQYHYKTTRPSFREVIQYPLLRFGKAVKPSFACLSASPCLTTYRRPNANSLLRNRDPSGFCQPSRILPDVARWILNEPLKVHTFCRNEARFQAFWSLQRGWGCRIPKCDRAFLQRRRDRDSRWDGASFCSTQS